MEFGVSGDLGLLVMLGQRREIESARIVLMEELPVMVEVKRPSHVQVSCWSMLN